LVGLKLGGNTKASSQKMSVKKEDLSKPTTLENMDATRIFGTKTWHSWCGHNTGKMTKG